MLRGKFVRNGWAWLIVAFTAFLPAGAGAGVTDEKFHVVRPDGRGEEFLAGFYLYPYAIRQTALRLQQDYSAYLDAWIGSLAQKGFNLFYVAADSPDFDAWLRLSEKYRFKLIVQLDFAYMTRPSLQEVRAKAPAAIDFIKTYQAHPNVLAFSVREEPDLAAMAALDEYFKLIRAAIPDAPLHLLQNRRNTLSYPFKGFPLISATDHYAFWGWDSSAGGYMATPASALDWFRNDLTPYAQYAQSGGAQFQVVFTTEVSFAVTTDAAARDGAFGEYERILQLARTGSQGWSQLDATRLQYTKYYRPPPNCTRAMVWLSIFNGARSILHWSGNPTAAMFGRENQGAYLLDEYAAAIGELQDYGWIVNRMQSSEDQGGAQVTGANAFIRVFDLPGFRGKVVLVVNTDVGTWRMNSIQSLVGRNDYFHIDRAGDIDGYIPKTALRPLRVHLLRPGSLAKLSDGTRLGPNGEIGVPPGGGMFLFMGDSAELEAVRRVSGLSLK